MCYKEWAVCFCETLSPKHKRSRSQVGLQHAPELLSVISWLSAKVSLLSRIQNATVPRITACKSLAESRVRLTRMAAG